MESSVSKLNFDFKPPPLPSSLPKPIYLDRQRLSSSSGSRGSVRLDPGQYEIMLYVDQNETTGRSESQNFINILKTNGVNILVRHLTVGDFVWVCREVSRIPHVQRKEQLVASSSPRELVLPYVVERKRTDDLAHSIRDGRFVAQNLRLAESKLKPIYLIERYGRSGENWGLGEGALDRAICDLEVEHGFWVQQTSTVKETCAYLTMMTRQLKKMYEGHTIVGCQKEEWMNSKDAGGDWEAYLMFFNQVNCRAKEKVWKAKEMFARHLMQIQGMSVEKAHAIILKYPTMDHLLQAYAECENKTEKDSLLASIDISSCIRKIGVKMSRKISRLYNTTNLV